MKGRDRAIFRHSYQAACQNALVAVRMVKADVLLATDTEFVESQ